MFCIANSRGPPAVHLSYRTKDQPVELGNILTSNCSETAIGSNSNSDMNMVLVLMHKTMDFQKQHTSCYFLELLQE